MDELEKLGFIKSSGSSYCGHEYIDYMLPILENGIADTDRGDSITIHKDPLGIWVEFSGYYSDIVSFTATQLRALYKVLEKEDIYGTLQTVDRFTGGV